MTRRSLAGRPFLYSLERIEFEKNFREKKLKIAELEENAESGDEEAKFTLAQCYMFVVGVEDNNQKNRTEAARLFRELANGDKITPIRTKSRFLIAELLRCEMAEPDSEIEKEYGYGEKVYWYGKAVEDAADPEVTKEKLPFHTEAFFQYAECVARGEKGIEGHKTISAMWYESAAKLGHAEAQNKIARCYSSGQGVVANRDTALSWHQEAAKRGHPGSLIYVAKYHSDMSKKKYNSEDQKKEREEHLKLVSDLRNIVMADTSGQNLRDKHDAKNFFEISTTVEAQMDFLNKKVETKEDEEGKKTGPETPASKLKNAMARSLKLTKPRSKL